MGKTSNESVVTKWACRGMFNGDYMVKSREFRVTAAMFVMLNPEEQSDDLKWLFRYSSRFPHKDSRLSDSAEQAIIKLETVQQDKINLLRDRIAESQEIITKVRRFLTHWKSTDSK